MMRVAKRKLVVVSAFGETQRAAKKLQDEEPVKPKKKVMSKMWCLEVAKTGRSTCIACKEKIDKDTLRIGVITFYPHRNCKWIHFTERCCAAHLLGACEDRFFGYKHLEDDTRETLTRMMTNINAVTLAPKMPEITGRLSMPMMANALTQRYNRFRAFRFGLPEEEKYSKNWNWRCLIATMLVCNTHETAMLKVTDRLFAEYPTPEDLHMWWSDKETQKEWKDWMEKNDLRHAGKKVGYILRANKNLIENYDGEVPNNREELQAMAGIGRHVASVTMAWVHQAPEFGIDTHVKRIMQRWGYTTPQQDDEQVENIVKQLIPEKQIGHFSRAFVDHGQQVCGYTPDCSNCYLKHSCPTASKMLDW